MGWFKQYSWFAIIGLAAVLMIGGECGLLYQTVRQSQAALGGLERAKSEGEALQRQKPALVPENESAVQSELAATEEKTRVLRASLAGTTSTPVVAPSANRPVEAYFQNAEFIEGARRLAAGHAVTIRADEDFGFSSHRHEGPRPELLAAVNRQRVAAKFLVEALLGSRPQALLSVRRGHPRPGPADEAPPNRGARAPSVRNELTAADHDVSDDFFEPAEALTLRQPALIETDAFQVEFTGTTVALRTFLNRLAQRDSPWAVRLVETETGSETKKSGRGAKAESGPIEVVAQSVSRFRVMLERIYLLDPSAK